MQPSESGLIFSSNPVGFSGEMRTLRTYHYPVFPLGVHDNRAYCEFKDWVGDILA
jgi:hypothetical protein